MTGDAYGWAELLEIWELGRAYERCRLGDLVDEVRAAGGPPLAPLTRAGWIAAQLAREERIAAELLDMERAALAVRAQIEAEAAGQPRRPWVTS